MPELPEVQAHAERLSAAFDGARLERSSPLSFSVLKTVVPSPDAAIGTAQYVATLTRARITFMLIDYDSPEASGADDLFEELCCPPAGFQ